MIVKNVFSKAVLASLSMVLVLGLNPVHGMETGSFNDDILTSSIKQLPVKDLGRCAQVSRKWNWISSRDRTWEEVAQQYEGSGGRFHGKFRFHGSSSWKEIVKESYPYWEELKETKGPLIIYRPISWEPLFEEVKAVKLSKNRFFSKLFQSGWEI